MEQTVSAVDIQVLLPSWQRSLKAARRSPRTIQSYTEAAEQLADFLVRSGMPTAVADIHREHVEAFIVDLAQRFRPATVGSGFAASSNCSDGRSRRARSPLTRWPACGPRRNLNPRRRVISNAELRGLLRGCEGPDFVSRHDTAILRTFIDTGARLSEVAGLRLQNVNLDDMTLTVVRKGSRIRVLPIGAKSVKAIDRYLRVRRSNLPELWLGGKGPMTASGIAQMVLRSVGLGSGNVRHARRLGRDNSLSGGPPPLPGSARGGSL